MKNAAAPKRRMPWAVKQRLGFIGDRLMAGQTVRRSDLMEKFGISMPQASVDIRQFNKAHPGAMQYDRSKKVYVPYRINAPSRDTIAAAKSLIAADDAWLEEVVHRDPSMIRDVAAALIFERER